MELPDAICYSFQESTCKIRSTIRSITEVPICRDFIQVAYIR